MFDLILGKATLYELGVVLDFKEKTIQIDKILLPMRNIANLQLKPCITNNEGTESQCPACRRASEYAKCHKAHHGDPGCKI